MQPSESHGLLSSRPGSCWLLCELRPPCAAVVVPGSQHLYISCNIGTIIYIAVLSQTQIVINVSLLKFLVLSSKFSFQHNECACAVCLIDIYKLAKKG